MKFLIGIFLFSVSFAQTTLASPWNLESDDDGIKVFSRSYPNSSIIGFKGIGTIDVPFDQIFNTIVDTKNYNKWMPLVEGTRVLKKESKVSQIIYLHVGMPWPVKDRYFINEGKAHRQKDGSYIVDIKSIPWDGTSEDKVEGWTTKSYFKISPVDGGKRTAITLELNQDPKGAVPAFLVNWVQSSWPREFFENIVDYNHSQKI